MTAEFFALKMGHTTDDRDGNHAAAHGAYKDFRKYKELQTRMQEQVHFMDRDLSFAPTATAARASRVEAVDITKEEFMNAAAALGFVMTFDQLDQAFVNM
jgi:hypothetical protein